MSQQRVSAFLDTLRELGVPEEEATVSYGEYVLKEIARIMVERLPAEAVVCRFGGDEFLAICPCGIQEEALAFSTQIEQSLLEKSIAASIGTAVYAGTEDECNENITLEKLVKIADARMYRIR